MKNKMGFVFGPNGVGKGTLAQGLSESLGYKALNMGNMIREWIDMNKRYDLMKIMDEGDFIDDSIVEESLKAKFIQLKEQNQLGNLIMDGVPRRHSQVKILKDICEKYNYLPEWIIVLSAPLEEILGRVRQRVVAPDGNVYHLVLNPPPAHFQASELHPRPDDRPEVVKKRYEYFIKDTFECLSDPFFANTKVLSIDGTKSIHEVYEEAEGFLEELEVSNNREQ